MGEMSSNDIVSKRRRERNRVTSRLNTRGVDVGELIDVRQDRAQLSAERFFFL